MKTLKHITITLLLLFITNVFSQEKPLQTIQKKYNTLLQEQNKGIAILVKKDNSIEKASLGNFNLTAQSVFSIGSATKTFTAILILQEMEKGNLKLTDSIGTYLSPIKNVDGALTIETLLSHESGLDEVIEKNILDIFFAKDDSVYNQNLLTQIEEHDPEMIGEFNYCNTNYMLLGKILEKITDQHYFDLLEQRIFKPLQLNNTYSYLHKNIKNLATPTHNDKDVTAYIDHRFYGNIANAAGSIASTLLDMEQFYTSLFETEKLLKKGSLQLMLSSGNEFYGLGIFKSEYNGTPFYGHGGNNIGYAFSNGYNPAAKELFVMFTNSIAIPLNSIESDVVGYLNNEIIENFKDVDIDNFKDYAGNYLMKEANLILKIAIENNKIFLISEAQGSKNELNQKDENTLIEKTSGVSLTKVKGNANSLTFSQSGFTTIIKRINN
ncbi:MAG: beta-lactamase family protein [Flavobacteriaceae bacterium]|nr:beta-lactamase family protein [Flavobacteriaceae bacterium]